MNGGFSMLKLDFLSMRSLHLAPKDKSHCEQVMHDITWNGCAGDGEFSNQLLGCSVPPGFRIRAGGLLPDRY